MPLRGFFVTGTDTGVGKTVVSAALMLRLRGHLAVRYWKPIQTGIEQDNDTTDVKRLGRCSDDEIFDRGVRLPRPVSPHLAARLNGTDIGAAQVADEIEREPDRHRSTWIVEGAGGVLVPLNESETMVDLITLLDIPVIVVARASLGTINHTLLTIEAVQRRRRRVAGIVMVGERHDDNRAAIEHFGHVAVLGEMPRLVPLTADALATWAGSELDPDGILFEAVR